MLCAQMKKTGGVFIVLGASLLQVQSGGLPRLVHRAWFTALGNDIFYRAEGR